MVILNEKSVMGLFGQYCYPLSRPPSRED